eukprot:GDKI01038485.1.p1 GENE.GDKI01038485.1~~GDKI01038485.1.p1  ORF type:complete len:273 (-),score=51.20 GDKI01038485.1:29-847(-)
MEDANGLPPKWTQMNTVESTTRLQQTTKGSHTTGTAANLTAHALASATGGDTTTIIGIGSLLSEKSARHTFPLLQRFRLGRLRGYRRVFGHPADIFFERGIANMFTLEISSLAAEPLTAEEMTHETHRNGFIVSIFEVSNDTLEAFHLREEEFRIVRAEVEEEEGGMVEGLLCARGSDEEYVQKWGIERLRTKWGKHGLTTIWNWQGPIYPCPVYCRHCVLAAKGHGDRVCADFLDNTYLWDRKTTLAEYLSTRPHILCTQPPPALAERYNG